MGQFHSLRLVVSVVTKSADANRYFRSPEAFPDFFLAQYLKQIGFDLWRERSSSINSADMSGQNTPKRLFWLLGRFLSRNNPFIETLFAEDSLRVSILVNKPHKNLVRNHVSRNCPQQPSTPDKQIW